MVPDPDFGQHPSNSRHLVYCPLRMVGVAQLVERWIVAPVAEGSNPFAHPLVTTFSVVPVTLSPGVRFVSLKAGLGLRSICFGQLRGL